MEAALQQIEKLYSDDDFEIDYNYVHDKCSDLLLR